ncbi:Uncharacterised protein [Mycobacteroides abscessus subsp. abscessus]|uniref:hypothetical protein n=1 Tax=Mycobacteroides abscessus TaxID=36809 RepID=UPI00092CC377|nr:hypothetical protein [Mycobacteroides abscessus]SHU93956.1 Uncharacterised protein [Mycobacteroides abscessus subsp. abscessus]SHX73652.1 Uncharacterised protein [Mycobacteroides abscessus subsp. abscessus]SIG86366.1 Uncharacterised protein [Mycobacteroides abscessus subsp. abscessus]SKD18803.1 Uncharacterised protein [Mycobacteroides abscessus subsp. abscessus]SKN09889.1 Uncharacterised protein [Mycobacteroides abscessus subsp. abscessus]
MDARKAIHEIIESIPNLFGMTRKVTIGAEGDTETIVYTQAQVADMIASILPDALKAKGHTVIELPGIESVPDQPRRRYVRVPITAQPWSDGEVRISPHGDEVAIRNVPDRLHMQDVPALASALMAAHSTWRRPKRR